MGKFLKFMTEQTTSILDEPVSAHKDAMVDGMKLIKYIDSVVDQYIKDSSSIIPLDPNLKDDFLRYLIMLGHPLAYKEVTEKTWLDFIRDRAMRKTDSSIGFSSFSSNPWALQTTQWNQYHP